MGWARLDDGFHDHPKVLGLPLEAVGLYTLVLTWANRHKAPHGLMGYIPVDLPQRFAGAKAKRLTAALVTAGMWDTEPHLGGWVIHDFVDYLSAADRPQTADEVRAARSEAGRRGAAARWSKAPERQVDSNLPSRQNAPVPARPAAAKAAAAADALPPPREPLDDELPIIAILRQRLSAAGLTASWSTVTAEQRQEIAELVVKHGGDGPLIDAAKRLHRANDPAVYASAWFATWRQMPTSAERLRVVAPSERCPEHGHEYEPVPCKLCRAELVAGER